MISRRGSTVAGILMGALIVGCKGLLDVPLPAGEVDQNSLASIAGAQAIRSQTLIELTWRFAGEIYQSSSPALQGGLFADEFTDGGAGPGAIGDITDRRVQSAALGGYPDFISPISRIRQDAIQAIAAVRRYHSPGYGPQVGEQFLLAGLIETQLAEDFCSGVPLSEIVPGGDITVGGPLTTAQMFAHAAADFDSASAQATNPTTAPIASNTADVALATRVRYAAAVGKGRAMLGLGNYAAALAATASVPDSFAYVIQYQAGNQQYTNFYDMSISPWTYTIADKEGANGLPFRSANDPRLPVQNSGATLSSNGVDTIYTTTRYATDGSSPIPLFSGIEARLIEAEAALGAGDPGTWLTRLNHLRRTMVTPVMADTGDPGTSTARVDLTFYERGFWLFGTGHRLGDLRRLVLLYHRAAITVFPSGQYIAGAAPAENFGPAYGTDIGFGIPASELLYNTHAKACAPGT